MALQGGHYGNHPGAAEQSHHSLRPTDQTVFEAANYMVECNVGAVPVLDGTQLVGIFSERDLMKRVVTEGRDPLSTYIAEVMSTDLHTVAPGSSFRRSHVPDADLRHSASAGMRWPDAGRLPLAARSAALSS